MKNILLTGLALIVVAVFVALASASAPLSADEGAMVDPEKAKALFVDTHKCNMCHGVAAAEVEAKTKSEKMYGGDLSGFESEGKFDKVAAYARKEAEIDGKTHKKEFKGTDEELQAILDWLGSLEAQE